MARKRRLAPPQVAADNFPPRAHNRSIRKHEAQLIAAQFPIRAFYVPGPWSLVLSFRLSAAKNLLTPHPPTPPGAVF